VARLGRTLKAWRQHGAAGWAASKVVQERLGHANISITLGAYSHILEEMDEDAAEKVAAVAWVSRDPRRGGLVSTWYHRPDFRRISGHRA
jgi:hypothetical protein